VASGRTVTGSFEEHAIRLQLAGPQPGVVRLEFEGGSAGSRLVGEGRASGIESPGAAFSGVRYAGLYDGIDVRVGETGGELEYDLLVAPGADVAEAEMHVEGGDAKVAADGSLI